MATKKEDVKKETKQAVDIDAFINRKLRVLNTKNGAKYERAMTRVLAKNKGGLA